MTKNTVSEIERRVVTRVFDAPGFSSDSPKNSDERNTKEVETAAFSYRVDRRQPFSRRIL